MAQVYQLSHTASEIDRILTDAKTVNSRIRTLDGNFAPEYENGAISVNTDKTLKYEDNALQIRTKENVTYKVPAGTSFKLSDYANDVKLVVYYSYDGVNYSSFVCKAEAPLFVTERDASVALKILGNTTRNDTSLSDRIVVDVLTLSTKCDYIQRDIADKLLPLDGIFAPEFEIGNMVVSGNKLDYSESIFYVRTKAGAVYKVPAGTAFKLSTYTDPSNSAVLKLFVYCSYDGGNTYDPDDVIVCKEENPLFVTEKDAVVALKINSSAKLTDTSISKLLEVNAPNMRSEVESLQADVESLQADVESLQADAKGVQSLVKKELNDTSFWEIGFISGTGEEKDSAQSASARTKDYIPEEVELVYAENDFVFYVALHDSADTYIGFWTGSGIAKDATHPLRYFNPKGLKGHKHTDESNNVFTVCKFRVWCKRAGSLPITLDDTCNIHFLNGIYKNAVYPKPTLTFIDDDGVKAALENWESIANEIGVKITSALITTGVGNESGNHVSWDDVHRLQNKGFEFISHTHRHIDIHETVYDKDGNLIDGGADKLRSDFKATMDALKEHGCESRFVAYPGDSASAQVLPIIKEYFSAGISGNNGDNIPPIYTHYIRRHSVLDGEAYRAANGENPGSMEKYPWRELNTLKSYVDAAIVNGSWLILTTHLRDDDLFIFDDEKRQIIIGLCKYAVEKGMTIQTFGEAFHRFKNITETGNAYGSGAYDIVDCNGVRHYREKTNA